MFNRSESTLFVQTALAMSGFLVFLTTVGWVMTPQNVVSQVTPLNGEVVNGR